jgi:hypothetical protein
MWCKHCGPDFPLRIEMREELEAKPIGTFSLAGVTPKFSAIKREWPMPYTTTASARVAATRRKAALTARASSQAVTPTSADHPRPNGVARRHPAAGT